MHTHTHTLKRILFKGSGEKNLREQDGRDGGRTERESKERDVLIEGAIMELTRNLALEKFPVIHQDDPS